MGKMDIEHWEGLADELILKGIKLHVNGYDPRLAPLEKLIRGCIASTGHTAYMAGREEASPETAAPEGGAKGVVTMQLSFAMAEALMGLSAVVGMCCAAEGVELPDVMRKAMSRLAEQIEKEEANAS